MLFLKVFDVGDNFDSRLSQFHIVAPLYEKHFRPFADFRMGISKSDLGLLSQWYDRTHFMSECYESHNVCPSYAERFTNEFIRDFIDVEIFHCVPLAIETNQDFIQSQPAGSNCFEMKQC